MGTNWTILTDGLMTRILGNANALHLGQEEFIEYRESDTTLDPSNVPIPEKASHSLPDPAVKYADDDGIQPYEYQPLKENEIRLLRLRPCDDVRGNDLTPILGQLSHYSLDEAPPFETLSYCWGNSSSDRRILIDGKSLSIKPNLEFALREFRLPHHLSNPQQEHRTLWIDAICINQQDLDELSQQVSLMCQIYSLSKDLVVWLGEEDRESRIASTFISSFAQRATGGIPGMQRAMPWAEKLSSTPLFPVIFHALEQFLCRPWFRRAWVLQEYILGGRNSTVFQCGKDQITGQAMEKLCKLIERGTLTRWAAQHRCTFTGGRWHALFEAGQHHERTKKEADAFSILQWLLQARYSEATNPRDKVYAVYGLFEAEKWSGYDSKTFIVDYTASVQDVFSGLVRTLVLASKRLNALLACGRRSSLVHRTWTPDWTVPSPDLQFIGRVVCEIKKLKFCAAGDSDAVVSFAENFLSLTVRALLWDVVSTISPITSDPAFAEFRSEAWKCVDEKKSYADHQTNVFINQTLGSRNEEIFKNALAHQVKDRVAQRAQASAKKREAKLGRPLNKVERNKVSAIQQMIPAMAGAMSDRINSMTRPNERVFVTERAYIGKDYSNAVRAGDIVCVLLGCPAPVILRTVENHFEFVRAVYVEGLMYGEAMAALEMGEVVLRDFELH